jgi:hypothetical protein
VGDGIAFWYTKFPIHSGSIILIKYVGLAMGANDVFDGLGIFIDTHANNPTIHKKFPFVSYMLNDGKNLFNHDKDGGSMALPGCHPSSKIINSVAPVKVVISYKSENLRMSINEQDCINIKGSINLNFEGYIGISAGTGASYSSHRVISIKTLKKKGKLKNIQNSEDDDFHAKLFFLVLLFSLVFYLIRKLTRKIRIKSFARFE